jgi:hypothetical protein
MTKHVGRKRRWTRQDAKTYSSEQGKVVYQQNAWFALLGYKTLAPPEREGGPPAWRTQSQRLGPFRRPRDAMVALEREAAMLQNRHGKQIVLGLP